MSFFSSGFSGFADQLGDFAGDIAGDLAGDFFGGGGGSRGGAGRGGYKTTTYTISGPGGTKTSTVRVPVAVGGGKGGAVSIGGYKIDMGGDGKPSRYSKGWGSQKAERTVPGQEIALEGKTYQEIRDECLANGTLFEDPDFPAEDLSIFYSRAPPRPFTWKRPSEICEDPHLFVGGASRFDVKQGELGNCWFLAAIAGLCQYKELLYRVVPPDQSFHDKYAGVFHFQFWQYGQWKDVIIDDRLPTYYDKLVFMHSADSNEFWTPLVEKAYAKLNGSYEALKGGSTSEAMEDFTGGVCEFFDFRQSIPPALFKIMLKAYDRNSLMGCSIEAKPGQLEAELDNGLIMGHAYSVTNVKLMSIQTSRTSGKIPMVRIRNPWGNECEWKGAWSDKSPEWQYISAEERSELGLTFDDDGEFWMSFQDFTKNFQKLEICHLGPECMSEEGGKKKWSMSAEDGGWKKRVNAGGCRNYIDTFWTNPQYRVTVVDADEDDDEDTGTLIVGLLQKERRKKRKEGLDLLTTGYAIYKIKDPNSGPLDLRFFKYNASSAKSAAFINLRENCGRHKLPPGTYCIIPSTFEPNQEGEFLLRLFTEKKVEAGEIDEETAFNEVEVPEASDEEKAQDSELREAFKQISGEDLEIDAYELRDILNTAFMKEFTFDGFSLETSRSMVAMMDLDRSGKLGFEEFKKLWNDLRLWKSVFKKFDQDKSGYFNSYELRTALNSVGIKVSNQTFNALVMRYSDKEGRIDFDDFILCAVRMKTMFDIFKDMKNQQGNAEFNLDAFIQTTMYS